MLYLPSTWQGSRGLRRVPAATVLLRLRMRREPPGRPPAIGAMRIPPRRLPQPRPPRAPPLSALLLERPRLRP